MATGKAFTADWFAWGRNLGGIKATGSQEFRIDWGDGTVEQLAVNADTNADGVPDQLEATHSYGSDGVYLVNVRDAFGGSQPEFLRAYFFTSDTSDRTIRGSGQDDLVIGGSGKDFIIGGAGNDLLVGSEGNDRVQGDAGNDIVIGDAGDDFLIGGSGQDLLGGGADNDRLYGGADTDFLYGDDGDDLLYANGSAGSDANFNYLDGGAGRDRLTGDAGDDILVGGAGSDYLTGGAGRDTFVFKAATDSTPSTIDIIADFQAGDGGDTIDLFELGPLTEIGTNAFDGSGDQVRYFVRGNVTFVQADLDGDRVADFSIRLNGALTLTDDNLFTTSDTL